MELYGPEKVSGFGYTGVLLVGSIHCWFFLTTTKLQSITRLLLRSVWKVLSWELGLGQPVKPTDTLYEIMVYTNTIDLTWFTA